MKFSLFTSFVLIGLIVCRPKAISQQNNLSPAEEEVRIEYLAHACFILEYKGSKLLIDPFASKIWIGYSFPEGIEADAVVITHPHYDHDGGRFRGKTPYWEGKMPIFENTGNFSLGKVELTGIHGKHCDPYGKEFDQKNIIWLMEFGDLRIAHLGDNGPLTEANYQQLGRVDILMAPIDEQWHILKEKELKTIIHRLQPKVLIPMHYRIAELEKPNQPKTLGGIDFYLQQPNTHKLRSNILRLSPQSLPNEMETIVFLHSPKLKR